MDKPSKICNTEKQCKVCERPGDGVRFGAFACNSCASFFHVIFYNIYFSGPKVNPVPKAPKFGLTASTLTAMRPCHNNRQCSAVENYFNSCNECRFRKCLNVGMHYDILKMYSNPYYKYKDDLKKTNIKAMLATITEAHLETIHLIGPTFDPIGTTEPKQRVSKPCCVIYFARSREIVHNAVKGVEAYAKKLFSVGRVLEWNQNILSNALFDVLLVRFARTFNPKSNTLTCWNGQDVVKGQFDSEKGKFLLRTHFWKDVFSFAEILYNLNLSDGEVNLFCLVVMFYVYHLDTKKPLISETYQALMEILTDFVKTNHREDFTNFFTAFNILLFQIRYLKNCHTGIPREIFEGANMFNPSPVPRQSTSQFAACPKSNPTFLDQRSGYQSQYHPSTASVEKSVSNPSSSIHSNPIIQCYPSNQQDLLMPPSGKAELEKKIVNQTEYFVPHDQNSSLQGGMQGSSQFSGQNQKLVEVIESETVSATGFCTISNEGLRDIHPNEHLNQTSPFSNLVDCPPIASEDSENFSNDDMPLDLSCKSKTLNDEYYFKKDS